MKKSVKVIAIGLATIALTLNLHGAISAYNGVGSFSLPGQVWGMGLSGYDGGGTSTQQLFGTEATSGCNHDNPLTTSLKIWGNYSSTASVGMVGGTITGITLGNSGGFHFETSYVTIVTPGKKVDCDGWSGICYTLDCRFPVGTQPSYIFYGGHSIPVGSGTSTSN